MRAKHFALSIYHSMCASVRYYSKQVIVMTEFGENESFMRPRAWSLLLSMIFEAVVLWSECILNWGQLNVIGQSKYYFWVISRHVESIYGCVHRPRTVNSTFCFAFRIHWTLPVPQNMLDASDSLITFAHIVSKLPYSAACQQLWKTLNFHQLLTIPQMVCRRWARSTAPGAI